MSMLIHFFQILMNIVTLKKATIRMEGQEQIMAQQIQKKDSLKYKVVQKCSERSKQLLKKCLQLYSEKEYNKLMDNIYQLKHLPDYQKQLVIKLFIKQIHLIKRSQKDQQHVQCLIQYTLTNNLTQLEKLLKILSNKRYNLVDQQNTKQSRSKSQILYQFGSRCRYILITTNFSPCQRLKTKLNEFDSFKSFSQYLYKEMNIKELYSQHYQFFEEQKGKNQLKISKSEIQLNITFKIIWLGQNIYQYILHKALGNQNLFQTKKYDKYISSSQPDQFCFLALGKLIQILQTNEQFKKFIEEYSREKFPKSGIKKQKRQKLPEQTFKLKKIIQEKDAQISTLKGKNSQKDKQIKILKNKDQQNKQLIDKLKRTIQELKPVQPKVPRQPILPKQPKQQDEIIELKMKIQSLMTQFKEQRLRYSDLSAEFDEFKRKSHLNISNLETQKNKEIKKLEDEFEKLLDEKQKIVQSLKKQQKKSADVFKQKLKAQKDLKDSKIENQRLQNQFKQLSNNKNNNNLMEQQINKLKIQIQGLQKKNKKFHQQIKKLNQKNQEILRENYSLKKQKQDDKIKYQNIIHELKVKNEQISNQKGTIKRLNNELEKKINNISTEIKKQFQKELEDKKELLVNLEIKLKNQGDDNHGLRRQIQQFESIKKKQIQKLQKNTQNMKYKYNQLDNQHRLALIDIKTLRESSRCYAQYFSGDILNTDNSEYTQWIVVSLEKMYKKIGRTNFLYKFDPLNPTSFHKYIDEKPFIIIFVKLKNGNIVGGFSEEPFKKNHSTQNKPGFLFNLNKKQHFQIKDQKDTQDNVPPTPIIWNDYFIMYGNAELRIRFGQNFVFSNFGANAGYFDNKGLFVGEFLGDDAKHSKQADFITYEFFSIVFEQ